jgi:hypothetical protein
MLDLWTPPSGAGDPVAVLASTFTLEPDFFERDCLARFVAVSSVDEETRSVADVVARIELEEKLAETRTTVLADRSTRADRSSLRWDLLHAHVPGGLLHAKVAVLLWSQATRVIIGSANLSAAGYRRQIELAMAADLGPRCVLPAAVLSELADELTSYLQLIPGHDGVHPAARRAEATIDLFRQRVAELKPAPARRAKLAAALAPSGSGRAPLPILTSVWDGPKPRRATQLSPFWDGADLSVVTQVRRLLSGHGAKLHAIAGVLTPEGELPIPQQVRDQVDATYELVRDDQELRTLHAKCLLVESDQWVAALVGSSNHTRAGMGLNGHASHRELNVWLGADANSDEGRWLRALVGLGRPVPTETASVEVADAEETDDLPPALPLGFGSCRLQRDEEGDQPGWRLVVQLDPAELPGAWAVRTSSGRILLTTAGWQAGGRPSASVVGVPDGELPAYVDVEWEGHSAPWTVVVDDPRSLPPSPEISQLTVRQLLNALAAGKSITAALRDELLAQLEQTVVEAAALDPLRRFDDQGSLLRRGRALSAALAQLQLRLERPVLAVDALEARLASPLGPRHLADKVSESVRDGEQSTAEALFTVAEIVLTVGRVGWSRTCTHLVPSDRDEAMAAVARTIEHLDRVRLDLGPEPALMAGYARRAHEEARRCLSV